MRYKLVATLALTVLPFLFATAQPNEIDRCGLRRIENEGLFEKWLQKKSVAARVPTMTIKLPVVVHVLHMGDPIGEGFNYSMARIEAQIRTLNEDFRRKENTPGFNSHPSGGDANIEFVLAQVDPHGKPTSGVVRVNMDSVKLEPTPPGSGDIVAVCSRYSYWNPEKYLNIWCMDAGLPPGTLFGSGRFPVSDLKGLDVQSPDGDGIFINAPNFGQGESNTVPNYDGGRTLTHEMGHFLGLLHTFGHKACGEYTDYCDDTPDLSSPTNGCPTVIPLACDGRPAMVENYMDYSFDACMNVFTRNQISRMHAVLMHSPRRSSLVTSNVIDRVDEPITRIPVAITPKVRMFPNPASDKLVIELGDGSHDFQVTIHDALGRIIFQEDASGSYLDVPLPGIPAGLILVAVKSEVGTVSQLILIK